MLQHIPMGRDVSTPLEVMLKHNLRHLQSINQRMEPKMTGYTVHTGSNEQFTAGWDTIFGAISGGKKKVTRRKKTKKRSTKKSAGKKKAAAQKRGKKS